jgi:hypothetical protein
MPVPHSLHLSSLFLPDKVEITLYGVFRFEHCVCISSFLTQYRSFILVSEIHVATYYHSLPLFLNGEEGISGRRRVQQESDKCSIQNGTYPKLRYT